MLTQHITEKDANQEQGIVVDRELLRDDAAHDVDVAAGDRCRDEADRPRRPFVLRVRENYPDFSRSLRLACDLFGSRRILFGTDWPFSETVMRNDAYANSFRRLTSNEKTDARFASIEVKQMLGGNAEKLLTNSKEA